ncbi:phospholipid carrier-dependent glycosyltransferase [bacterium]|nr:phospholipid carrier-dependent glycosyltransferase [bacterium]
MTRESSWVDRFRHFSSWATAPERIRCTIFLVLLVTGLAGSAQTGLFDRDEPRYAQATREMIASGDWFLPSFNGEPRLHKPVLIYWLMAPFYYAIGDSPLAARMPSILAAAISGVLVYSLANRWWGLRVGLWATIVWATAPLTVVESRMATTDAVLNALILGMTLCLTRLYGGPEARSARAFWVLAGVSILTKGPVGLLFPLAGLAAARYFTGVRMPAAWLRPREGLAIVAAIVTPWLAAVTWRTQGEFLRFAVGREFLGRTVAPAEGHGGFPGYYLALLVPLFLPWSIFLPGALKKAWSARTEDPRVAFLLGFAAGPLVVLELVSTKLVHYHYPAYAALAMLVGVQIAELERSTLRPNLQNYGRFLRISLNSFSVALMLAASGLAWAFPGTAAAPCLIIVSAMGYALYRSIPAIRDGHWGVAIRTSSLGWAVTLVAILAWLLPAYESKRLAVRVAETLRENSERFPVSVALAEFRDPSVIHALKSDKPIPIVRRQKDIKSLIESEGAMIVPLSPREIEKLEADGELRYQVLADIEAYDWDRGKRRKIAVTLLTADPANRLARLPGGALRQALLETEPVRR